MFTGIVQGLGEVAANQAGVLAIRPREAQDWQVGESVAVNGVCLTVVGSGQDLRFDLSPETLDRTAFGHLAPGNLVNLERALRPTDRLGGHFVQGHIDAVGTIAAIRKEGNSHVLTFQAPPQYDRYLIEKGSICIDGVSLTVVGPDQGQFDVWMIPHTLHMTTFQHAATGQKVNLEFDMLAKYLEKLLPAR